VEVVSKRDVVYQTQSVISIGEVKRIVSYASSIAGVSSENGLQTTFRQSSSCSRCSWRAGGCISCIDTMHLGSCAISDTCCVMLLQRSSISSRKRWRSLMYSEYALGVYGNKSIARSIANKSQASAKQYIKWSERIKLSMALGRLSPTTRHVSYGPTHRSCDNCHCSLCYEASLMLLTSWCKQNRSAVISSALPCAHEPVTIASFSITEMKLPPKVLSVYNASRRRGTLAKNDVKMCGPESIWHIWGTFAGPSALSKETQYGSTYNIFEEICAKGDHEAVSLSYVKQRMWSADSGKFPISGGTCIVWSRCVKVLRYQSAGWTQNIWQLILVLNPSHTLPTTGACY
jgi:hypothetical protein